ncbi:TPR-like protein [Dothidotthia symphoricarpi CBS 119687]|uniref:TPR-like protein n=1 Tax=Dothidotthia symphoricarpi CBS 119687 TaxID=1392245 RepID=A0A6A6AQ12_9PLEO|nr:TPR-like protein [Dothidotthia symphoricarpi CBS 119687]KAF2133626.1 TPR-like protein [Dothidotthia symphoricarpi CBS 119687]
MAEALATLAVVASILQVVDLGVRVIKRLEDFREEAGGLPKAFTHISRRLPILIDALRKTKQIMENGSIAESTREAFAPAVEECSRQIAKLDSTIDRALPKIGDSGMTRKWKAVASVKYDSEVQEMDKVIGMYMDTMTQHHIISAAAKDSALAKAPPIPTTTCPFRRDQDFVHRDALDQVTSRNRPGSITALVGMGGVGKSQIAIEYAHQTRDASHQTWVFWVHAEKITSFEEDYRKIAKAVCLPGCDEKGADVLTLVRDWLDDETNGPWVLIFDNVDDVNVLTAPSPKAQPPTVDDGSWTAPQIREFVPRSQNGLILLTSRSREAAQMITGNLNYHIDVEEMNEVEAITLLKSKLKPNDIYANDDFVQLVKALDYIPLAISQAAAFISLNYPRVTIPKYLESLAKPNQDTERLLEESVHESNRSVHRSNSIVKTWQLSFQYVRETHPSAARLLSLMCLFDRQGIPEALLTDQYGEEATEAVAPLQPRLSWWKRIRRRRLNKRKRPMEKRQHRRERKCNFDADWRTITNFSLIKTNADGQHFNMHGLVQYTTRRWLEMNHELEVWKRRYVAIMSDFFPQPEHDNWKICQYLFPHAQQAAQYRPIDRPALLVWTPLIQRVAQFPSVIGSYTTAEDLWRTALATFEAHMGERNENTLRCLHHLGSVLVTLKNYPEAEILLRRAWEGRQVLLGPDHIDTLDSAHGLGGVLNIQKKWQEGELMQARVIEGRGNLFGPEHIELQSLVGGLAFSSVNNGRYEQAEALHQQVSDIRKAAFGEESDDTYKNMRALAVLQHTQGKFTEAEALHRQVVTTREQRSGLHDAETIKSINFLGEALDKQGNYDEAVQQYQRVVDVFTDLDNKAREEALWSMDNLAQVFSKQGKLVEAEEVGRRLIEEREKLLGVDDLDTLIGVHTLADILTQQERFQDATLLYERAYVGTEKKLGPEHPDTIEFLNDLNSAKNKRILWAGEEGYCVIDNNALELASVAPGMLVFQSPVPIAV